MSSSELFAKLVKKQPVEQKQRGGKKTTMQNKKEIVVEKEIQQQTNEAITDTKNNNSEKDKDVTVDGTKDGELSTDGLSAIIAAHIASQFPLLSNDPNVHAIDNSTKVFAAAGTGKHIYWDKKVNYYRSQRLYPTKMYDNMIPRGQDTPFTWPMLLSAAEIGDEFNVKTLLAKSIVLPPEKKTLNASIVRASRNGHLHTVRMIINYGRGASPDAIDMLDERAKYSNRKFVALHEAAKAGHDNVVSCLLDRGADPHLRGSFNRSILHMAAEGGFSKCVHIVLGWILADGWAHEVHAVDDMGNQAIHMAAKEGHDEVLKILLRNHARINSRTNDMSTSLLLATKAGHDKVVQILIENHANPYLPDKTGETPFQWAIFKKREKLVDILLPAQINYRSPTINDDDHDESGSVIDIAPPLKYKNKAGETILITTVKSNYQDVAKKLIDAGANVDDQTINGDTALHWSARKGFYEMSSMLLDNGASLSILNRYNMTPFEIASENSTSFEFVMLFLKGGEDGDDSGFQFKRRSEKGLLCACQYGRLKTVQQLIDKIRVDRQCSDSDGNTCLHLATQFGHDDVVKLLLKRGVSKKRENKLGETPFEVGKKYGKTLCCEILELPFGAF